MQGKSIEIIDLKKGFSDTQVLRRINLDICEGEFLTLLGPSGCGKSTLLRLIAGFEAADNGQILIGGKNVAPLPPKSRDIAMVFQSYALYPHMSARANIGIPIEMSRLSFWQRQPFASLLSAKVRAIRREINSNIDAVAKQIGLETVLDRKPAQLSGGQRQRVAVGRALIRQPSVFLMDEPLSNLDTKLRQQLREEIVALHRKTGITFVYVTHDQTEAMAMSDRIAVMENGEILQCDTPKRIYDYPEHISVARFVGVTAINEIPIVIKNNTAFLSGLPCFLTLPSLADGVYHLAVRPERLQVVAKDVGDFTLPVDHVEFTGNEVAICCKGEKIGAKAIWVQLRPENFAQLEQEGKIGQEVTVKLGINSTLIFDQSGRRIAHIPVPKAPVTEKSGARHVVYA